MAETRSGHTGRPFAVALSWGVALCVAGIFMVLVGMAQPTTEEFGNATTNGWLWAGGVAEVVGLLLLLTGLYEFLSSVQEHFALARRRVS
ncbi:hypothetical protein GCM10009584_27510 [Ornithinimicrobium humiphilum]|uniref:Uncharacterized protein n=1 Tax=Ornithinimicrobium humiphilum TaxID=125288 RepID=A0A543KP37_9MICO|nr:hypothetical protein [Ornithinimicrobium humiphilum]TQM96830.1 hypothetical protein FB476_1722 [Ornithinimicrobium humiphilum]